MGVEHIPIALHVGVLANKSLNTASMSSLADQPLWVACHTPRESRASPKQLVRETCQTAVMLSHHSIRKSIHLLDVSMEQVEIAEHVPAIPR